MSQKVLIIDDAEAVHRLVKARLSDERLEVHSAFDSESGLKAASAVQPDLILLDVNLGPADGFRVCRDLKADPMTMAIPLIFLTAATDTEHKIRGLELGAVDYITKPFDAAELRARVRATLRTKYLMDLLEKRAMIDGLTGLWNRACFERRLPAEISLARRAEHPLSCVVLDVDHFKSVNDRFGHRCGDAVLAGVANLMSSRCRAEDAACRYGGEEFVMLLPNTGPAGAAVLAEDLRKSIEQNSFAHDGQSVRVTCSMGVAGGIGADMTLFERADKALYQAKSAGRNNVVTDNTQPAPVQTLRPTG